MHGPARKDMIRSFETLCLALGLCPLLHFLSFQTLCGISAVALCLYFLRRLRHRKRQRFHMGGHVTAGFEHVAEVFRRNLQTGQEQGAAFAVYQGGRLVVDLWGGYADFGALRYRAADSISMAYSSTKMVTSLVLAHLVDAGRLEYEAPVGRYWPEFAVGEKKGITVQTLLSHRSGLIAIKEKHRLSLTRDDPDKLAAILATQEPFWTPGSGQGYQVLTFGLYADQLVRRVDHKHRSLAEYFEQEIAKPFDVDFHIGQPRHLHHRSCRETRANFGLLYHFTTTLPTGILFLWRALYSFLVYGQVYLINYIGNPTDWKPRRLNDPSYREVPSGASHGFGTARGLAKLMGILGNGGQHDGKTLLSGKILSRLNNPLSDDFDRVVLRNITYGPGTVIETVRDRKGKPVRIFGHWGAGGQMAYADPTHGLGWAYLTNYSNILHGFIVDHRYSSLRSALYECVHNMDTATQTSAQATN